MARIASTMLNGLWPDLSGMMPPDGSSRLRTGTRRQKCANRTFLSSCRTPDKGPIGAA